MVPDVLTRALAPRLAQFSRELGRARRGVVRGVHQSRVASRRLREGLGALESVVADDVRRRALRALRDMARALGAVRECDVTIALVGTQAARHEWPPTAVSQVLQSLQADRKRRQRDLLRVLADPRRRRAVAQVRSHLPEVRTVETRRAVTDAAAHRRRKRAVALAKELRHLGTLYVPDQLHAVRLATKKLRYALEWEQQVGRRGWARERQLLERAQEALGAWHDVLILQERLHRVRRSGDWSRVTTSDLKHMAAQLERECRAHHASILAMVPAIARVAQAANR